MRQRGLALAVSLCIVLGLAACGGDTAESAPQSSGLTAEALLETSTPDTAEEDDSIYASGISVADFTAAYNAALPNGATPLEFPAEFEDYHRVYTSLGDQSRSVNRAVYFNENKIIDGFSITLYFDMAPEFISAEGYEDKLAEHAESELAIALEVLGLPETVEDLRALPWEYSFSGLTPDKTLDCGRYFISERVNWRYQPGTVEYQLDDEGNEVPSYIECIVQWV